MRLLIGLFAFAHYDFYKKILCAKWPIFDDLEGSRALSTSKYRAGNSNVSIWPDFLQQHLIKIVPIFRGFEDMEDISPSESTGELIPRPRPLNRRECVHLSKWYFQITAPLVGVFAIVALALLIFSSVYVNVPGPFSIYSHFAALFMATCLIFQCGQAILLRRQWMHNTSKFRHIFRWTYWIVIVLTTFISSIGYAISGKSDATAVQFLAFTVGLIGITLLLHHDSSHFEHRIFPQSRWYIKIARILNRAFKIMHSAFSILFAIGAITLALQYRYTNPGQIYNVSLEDGRTRAFSVYCTGPPSTTIPTLWFESSPAHGVTDFLGVQTYLSINHGRQSCSYDHLNFGWSERAPKDFTNSSMYWSSMLKALGRQDEPYIGIGWGGGGEDVLSHALESPSTTKGVVFVDASPDGIEWMYPAIENGWDETQMLEYRQQDLASRISLVRLILTLAIPWGLMPIFVPSNSTEYFDQKQYARHLAQSLKEDMWALQYYALLNMRAQKNISTYLTDTVLAPSIPVYSIMTNNSNTASDTYSLGLKVDMVEHLAGGREKVRGWAWCTDRDCDLGFPVTKARWTAYALVALGI